MAEGETKVIQAPCERCVAQTRHEILGSTTKRVTEPDGFWMDCTNHMIRCAGCHTVSLMRRVTCSQWMDPERGYEPEITFFPPPLTRRPPVWVRQLPEAMAGLLEEVYDARRSQWVRLTAMGVRAVIDEVLRAEIGDEGGFEQKLERLQSQGLISLEQKKTLLVVVDAGSAAGHRGFKPSDALVDAMIDTIESILHHRYVLRPMVETLQKTIPPRPPRPARS